MAHVPTPLVDLPVPVILDSAEMVSPATVSRNHIFVFNFDKHSHFIFYYLKNLHKKILLDINECTAGTDNCSNDGTCSNIAGSFSCACNSGYSGNGVTCSGK